MSFIKSLWSDAIYQYLYEDPDLNTMFDRSYESLIRAGGNKIVLPTLASGVSLSRSDNQSVGAGLPRTPADISKSSMEFSIYEYSTDPIVIRNLDIVQGDRAIFQKNVTEIGKIIKEFIFTTMLTELITSVDATHKLAWTGTNGAKFSYADLKKMRKTLTNAKILLDNRYAVISTDAEDNLFDDDYLKNWFAVNQQAVQSGTLPNLAGFSFGPSVLIPTTKADGTIDANPALNTKANVLAWRKEYANLVVQTDMEIIGSEQAQYLGGVYAFTTRFGTKLERAKGAVQMTQQ